MIRILDEEGHPVIGELLVTLRDSRHQVQRGVFRDALRRMGRFLAFELARWLRVRQQTVETSRGNRVEPVFAEVPVVACVLRAAMPLWDGLLEVFHQSDTLILGAARREGTMDPANGTVEVDLSYASLVPLEGRTLIYADPMLATGSTLRRIHPLVLQRAGPPRRVIVAGVVAWRQTLRLLEEELGADILVASADEGLDARGYIVPGLGDAGDLAFGPKAN